MVRVPISASWSFSPAASCSSWDIRACSSRLVSLESASFLCFPFLVGGSGAASAPLGMEPSAWPLTLLGMLGGCKSASSGGHASGG